ncbi:MAG: hypothetical protein U5K56_10215 [Halioglobus sp.]|nr:hypothetical protein [Halioglobus sp.]
MPLKKLWLSRRLARADALLLKGRLDDAQMLYVKILNAWPPDTVLVSANAGLAETEYRRGSVRNGRYYAGLCLKSVEAEPSLAESPGLQQRLDRLRSYLEEND